MVKYKLRMVKDKDMEYNSILMVLYTKGTGMLIRSTERVRLYFARGISIMGIGRVIRHMDLGFILIETGRSMRGNGRIIFKK